MWRPLSDKTEVVSKPGDHQDAMISFGRDHTTSSLQGSEITCESDHWIPMFPYPASWHTPPSPRMACECLAAIDVALLRSGVKAKASLSPDKWARQDISTETQPNPPLKHTNAHHFTLLVSINVGHTPRDRGILSSYSSCLSTRFDQILTYLDQTQTIPQTPYTLQTQPVGC